MKRTPVLEGITPMVIPVPSGYIKPADMIGFPAHLQADISFPLPISTQSPHHFTLRYFSLEVDTFPDELKGARANVQVDGRRVDW